MFRSPNNQKSRRLRAFRLLMVNILKYIGTTNLGTKEQPMPMIPKEWGRGLCLIETAVSRVPTFSTGTDARGGMLEKGLR